MKQLIQCCMLGLVAAGVMLSPARPVVAQSGGEPAIIISAAKVDEWLGDIKYLMESAGQGGMYGLIEMQAGTMLNGLDRSRNLGGLVYFDDNGEPKWMGMVPVKNIDDMLDVLSANGMNVDEDGDNYVIDGPSGELFIREVNSYAVISDNAEMLDSVPSNSGELLGQVSPDFNVGARIYVQRIPEALRGMMIAGIEEGFMETIDQMEDDAMADMQRKNAELQMEAMRSLINDSDELIVGLNIDQNSKSIHFDVEMTGKPGSELARASESYANAEPTKFGGFNSDSAAMNMSATMKLSPEDADKAIVQMDNVFDGAKKQAEESGASGEELEMVSGLLDNLADVLKETLKEGNLDFGAMGNISESEANFLAGFGVANPGKLESSIKELVSQVENKAGNKAEFNLDMGTHEGVRLHEITVDVSDDENAVQMFGEQLRMYVGIGEKAVYIGAGSDPLDSLKSAISGQGGDREVAMKFDMRLAPIMEKGAAIEDNPMVAQMAQLLRESGRDQIAFTMKSITNGMQMRLNIEDGLLALGGLAGGMMGGGGGPDF